MDKICTTFVKMDRCPESRVAANRRQEKIDLHSQASKCQSIYSCWWVACVVTFSSVETKVDLFLSAGCMRLGRQIRKRLDDGGVGHRAVAHVGVGSGVNPNLV